MSKMKIVAAAIITSAVSVTGIQAGDTYQADLTHASIGFKVDHLVISKVKGQFDDFAATLELGDDNELLSAEATVKTASVDTSNEKRDGHLRSDEFFNSEKFPEIQFKSTVIADGKLKGDFTLMGVTKEISMPYTIKGPIEDPWGNTKVGLEASTTINRTDFGMEYNSPLKTGGLLIGEKVELTIDVEFGKQ